MLLLIFAILVAAAALVTAPLRRGAEAEDEGPGAERAALDAAKEAKYREIRDAELDRRTGKLDDADWRAIDRQLRAEAVELLRRIDALGEPAEGGEGPPPAR